MQELTKTLSQILFIIIGILIAVSFFYSRDLVAEATFEKAVASVVNLYCTADGVDIAGGSGTVITSTGLIISNAHVVHQIGAPVSAGVKRECTVVFPNQETGTPESYYTGDVILSPKYSNDYDLGFVRITGSYSDPLVEREESEYPREFPSLESGKVCAEYKPELGEEVRAYGYPALIGGYYLSKTDGIISSIAMDKGFLITSAKVSSGNSGGLVLNREGCFIGIPTSVTFDQLESLGVIVSKERIQEFIGKIEKEEPEIFELIKE